MATTPYSDTFFDHHESGSLTSARIVLGELWHHVQPTSVIDVGCGRGIWLKVASEFGASSIAGVDGDYVRRDRLWIDNAAFHACNLETESWRAAFPEGACFDLVISLEVAEHLPENRAASFVSNLCSLGDLILFSAAISGQSGANHINKQWPGYWNALFREREFCCFDILRPKIWASDEIDWWYAQNVLLFARMGTETYGAIFRVGPPTSNPMALIHPRMHAAIVTWYEDKISILEHEIQS